MKRPKEKTESARVLTVTLDEYRKWAKDTGRSLTFLINAALVRYIQQEKEAAQ